MFNGQANIGVATRVSATVFEVLVFTPAAGRIRAIAKRQHGRILREKAHAFEILNRFTRIYLASTDTDGVKESPRRTDG